MRNLSAAALVKIAEQYGTEPIVILEISWAEGTDNQMYADADVEYTNIPGKILRVSELDNIINITESSDSQEISVVLDDTDGQIKSIMNANDIHKRDVWVYQTFKGLTLDDRFLLFRGKISSPIEWSEGERTVSFSVVSQLEDKEVGFSPEEGQFPYIPKDLIGKTWPLCFGKPINVPAVQITKAITGTTLTGVGIVSGGNQHLNLNSGGAPPDTRLTNNQRNHFSMVSQIWGVASAFSEKAAAIAEEYNDKVIELDKQMNEANRAYVEREGCAKQKRELTLSNAENYGNGENPIKILGGEDFPRGVITLAIGGGLFTGYFIADSNEFFVTSRQHDIDEDKADKRAVEEINPCTGVIAPVPEPYEFWDRIPPSGVHDFGHPGWYKSAGTILPRHTGSTNQPDQVLQQFWAEPGAIVRIASDEPMSYVVSTVPGTVLQVKAYKDFHGEKKLIDLPSDIYTVQNITYGTVETVQVVTKKPLGAYEDQEWSGEDIYVTFESDIGPNIVDILEYLITNYSDLTTNAASFAAVETKLIPFPANFAILNRTNIVDVLQEIAFQARCSLRISNGIFFLSYLPEEPTAVATLTEDDIENQSVIVSLTPTEDLVTKYVAEWRLDYAQGDLNKIVLRHNVNKYGVQENKYEFYIYNQPDIIFKVATFWLIRKANSWKKLHCRVFLNHMNLEAFDAVTLDFNTNYVANTDIKAIIEEAAYNSKEHVIEFMCWVPVKSGSMVEYPFAWPADEEADAAFPTEEEYDAGNAGGDGIGADAFGNLPVGQVPVGGGSIFVGGPNVVFGPQTDHGDPHPSDQGFVAQDLGISSTFGELTTIPKPYLYLKMNYVVPTEDTGILESKDEIFLVLEETEIYSAEDEKKIGVLADLMAFTGETDEDGNLGLKLEAPVVKTSEPEVFGSLENVFMIAEQEETASLAIKTTALFTNEEDEADIGEFDFMFDSEGEKWGAGTAFLQD